MPKNAQEVRFLKYCVKKGEEKARVYYSRTAGGVWIYAKEYGNELYPIFKDEAETINKTDTMTDYHCKDSVFIGEDHRLFPKLKSLG